MIKDSENQTESELLLLDLGLRAFQARHGVYPKSLVDLVTAHIIRRVPEDPFAREAGTSFRYRPLTDGTFLLYSVGPDGTDDGGRPSITTGRTSDHMTKASKGDWVVGMNVGAASKPTNRTN